MRNRNRNRNQNETKKEEEEDKTTTRNIYDIAKTKKIDKVESLNQASKLSVKIFSVQNKHLYSKCYREISFFW